MKKARTIFVTLISLLLITLCGCSSEEDLNRVPDFYSVLTAMEGKADITAHYPDYASSFSFSFIYSTDEGRVCELEVLSPESIGGIRVIIDENGNTIEYGSVSVEAGSPDDTALSPAALIPQLLSLWADGVVYELGGEKHDDTECVSVTYKSAYDGAELLYRTFFETETLKPVYAETIFDGVVTLTCDFKLVSF